MNALPTLEQAVAIRPAKRHVPPRDDDRHVDGDIDPGWAI